jgi:putative transposase
MSTLTHKIKLNATCKQQQYFKKACGVARFTWNWALAKWDEKYQAGEKTSALELKKEFNRLKPTEFPWIYEVTKYASQQPFIHLQKAYEAFFKKRARHPNFKKKGMRDSFYIGGDQLKIIRQKVKIPNLGWVKLTEELRFTGKIISGTISRTADYWFISITVETDQKPKACENQAIIGLDLGIKNLATLSNGEVIINKKPLKQSLKRLKRIQRRLSRQQKGSKNREKTKKALARQHYKISCKRNNALHKLSTNLTDRYRYIVIEDLAISDMVKNRQLSQQIMDGGWYEFRRQLSYKAGLKGNKIFVADRWFASSKHCSSCGYKKATLGLEERIYRCSSCGLEMDRDLNAAKCLERLVSTESSSGIDACGQEGSVIMLKTLLQPAWLNQELSPV